MKTYRLMLLVVLGSLLATCKKPECVKPQYPAEEGPCAGEHEVSAEFDAGRLSRLGVVESFVSSWIQPEGEEGAFYAIGSPGNGSFLRFKALEDNADYLWTIGNGTYDTQYGLLSFDESLTGQTITATLVVQKNPNLECFPDDDGLDTITRNIKIVGFDLPIFGKYEGAWSTDPSDIFVLEIQPYFSNIGNFDGLYLIGFNNINSDDTCASVTIGFGARYASFRGSTLDGCDFFLNGEAHLAANGEDIRIHYSNSPEHDGVDRKIFTGHKIN